MTRSSNFYQKMSEIVGITITPEAELPDLEARIAALSEGKKEALGQLLDAGMLDPELPFGATDTMGLVALGSVDGAHSLGTTDNTPAAVVAADLANEKQVENTWTDLFTVQARRFKRGLRVKEHKLNSKIYELRDAEAGKRMLDTAYELFGSLVSGESSAQSLRRSFSRKLLQSEEHAKFIADLARLGMALGSSPRIAGTYGKRVSTLVEAGHSALAGVMKKSSTGVARDGRVIVRGLDVKVTTSDRKLLTLESVKAHESRGDKVFLKIVLETKTRPHGQFYVITKGSAKSTQVQHIPPSPTLPQPVAQPRSYVPVRKGRSHIGLPRPH
jgi:hypothetical protein